MEDNNKNNNLQRIKTRLEIAQLKQLTKLMESIPAFAQDKDESQWTALGGENIVYSEQDVTNMQEQARELFYKDPGARGLIDTMVNFIIGKHAVAVPDDLDPTVKAYWDAFVDTNDWDMRSKELVRRTLRDGEGFLRFFTPTVSVTDLSNATETPLTATVPKVRFIDPIEIKDSTGSYSYGIETDENDIEVPLRYYRSYTDSHEAPQIETIDAAEILHTKILVDSDVKRGVSFLVGNAKYLTKYREWLDDRIVLNKIRTLFNLIMKVSGDPSTIKNKFEDTENTQSTLDRKKLPARGSVLIGTQGIEYEFANLNIHAEDTKDDGRNIELMICKGTGLTEYVVRGDASNANYSSSMVSESPMVRTFEAWQDFFEKVFQKVFKRVINCGIGIGAIPKVTKQLVSTFSLEAGSIETKIETRPTLTSCAIDFAQLIHRDPKKDSEAATMHRNMRLVSRRTLAGKFGYNYDEEQTLIEQEVDEDVQPNTSNNLNNANASTKKNDDDDDDTNE